MKGKFNDGNNPTAIFVSVMILLFSMFGGVIVCTILKLQMEGTFLVAFGSVGLCLLSGYILTKGSFSADKRGVKFKVGFATHYYFYKNIKHISVDTIFESARRGGKIPYVQIKFWLINGETVKFCDVVPNSRSDTIEDIQQYQAEHQFTELCDYIKEKIEKSDDWKKEYI